MATQSNHDSWQTRGTGRLGGVNLVSHSLLSRYFLRAELGLQQLALGLTKRFFSGEEQAATRTSFLDVCKTGEGPSQDRS